MEQRNYKDPKCNNRSYETDTISKAGSELRKVFDLFTT